MRNSIPFLFLILLSISSCQYLNRQIPEQNELLQKELKNINWNQVDELPNFASCDSLAEKTQKNQCFFDYLTQLIQQKLSSDTLTVLYPQLDTINVKVTVLADATFQFEPQLNDTLSYDANKIDSIIKTRLVDFPKVNPAIKRGIPVKTQFVLPVILDVAKQ